MLENTGDIESLRSQVEQLWPRLEAGEQLKPAGGVIKIETASNQLRSRRAASLRNCLARGIVTVLKGIQVSKKAMKLRQFVLIVLLVGGFWFVTTHFPSGLNRLALTSARGSSSPLELTEAHAAPEFDAEEQNNISVYKRVLPSVVNITSRAVIFNFFYGTVPQEGQGSGFILDKAGHVLDQLPCGGGRQPRH